MWSVAQLGRLAEKNSHREKKRDGRKGHLKTETYSLQRTTDTPQAWRSYLSICCVKHQYIVIRYLCYVLVWGHLSGRDSTSSRTASPWRPAHGGPKQKQWRSGLPGQHSFARRCTHCWCNPSTHGHGEMNTLSDTNHPSLTLPLAHANLQADRQQGGSDCVTLCSAGGLLVGLFSLVWCRLFLLATVQQHGLDAVSISQEEGVALAGRHVPNSEAIRQLQFRR